MGLAAMIGRRALRGIGGNLLDLGVAILGAERVEAWEAGQLGIRVEIESNLRQQLLTVDAKLRNLEAGLRKLFPPRFFDDPDVYTRPDRFRGDTATERGGRRINWSPGYRRYHRIRYRRNGIQISSRRPYHPEISEATRKRMAGALLRWSLESDEDYGGLTSQITDLGDAITDLSTRTSG